MWTRTRPAPHRPRVGATAAALTVLVGLAAVSSGQPAAAHPRAALASTTSAAYGWITTADGSRRVSALSARELKASTALSAVQLAVDSTVRYQHMAGFGAALTESSAHLLMGLSASARTSTLRSLFDPASGAGISMVRLPLGASDFALSRYTYDDVPTGRTDPGLTAFSISHDEAEIIPVLREALSINPALQIMATPWSAPAWMKTSQSLIGGSLTDSSIDVYATYLARAVQAYRSRGIPVRMVTLQNEPLYSAPDYPSMTLSPNQEASLASALAAKLAAAGLGDVSLIGYDHNWDTTTYATSLLSAAGPDVAGTAWHCYAGAPDAQNTVHAAFPDKAIYITECSGGTWATNFGGNLGWNAATLLVGAPRAWATSVLWWNLALDPRGGPHTGGCTGCRGVVTIDPTRGTVARNVEYDLVALAGRAVSRGAVRVSSPASRYGVQTVAYLNPDGSHVLTAYNSWQSSQTIVVSDGTTKVGAPLPAGAVVTLRW